MEYCTCSWFITRKWDSLYSDFVSSEFAMTAEIPNILCPSSLPSYTAHHHKRAKVRKIWLFFSVLSKECYVYLLQLFRQLFKADCNQGHFEPTLPDVFSSLIALPNLYFGIWPHNHNNTAFQCLNKSTWQLW